MVRLTLPDRRKPLRTIPKLGLLATSVGCIAAFVGGALAAPAAPHVKISMAEARTKALEVVPGNVIDAELEKENGAWRYSFDIKFNGEMHEVGIDADNGKIVENSLATPVKHD
jgi:uncharacterized membrane protein YkoI